MSNFKAGDIVAIATHPYSANYIVTKVSGGKVRVMTWQDWGIIGRFWPIRYYTVPVEMICEPKEGYDGPPNCATGVPTDKPPVSDPNEPKDRPL